MDRIMDIYEIMRNVSRISFKAKSLEGSSTGWNYVGKGNVVIKEEGDRLYFIEDRVKNIGAVIKYHNKSFLTAFFKIFYFVIFLSKLP